MTAETYYTQWGLAPDASRSEIEAVYRRLRERSTLGGEDTAEIDHIYHVLVDPVQRQQYDATIGLQQPARQTQRRGLSVRERWYALGGAGAALALIAVMWLLTGRGEPPPPPMGEVQRPAPEISLPTLEGRSVQLSDYAGQVVLVNFWGTWCEPCRREMPALQTAYEQLRSQGFVIIGVNMTEDELTRGNDEAAVAAFAAEYGVTYPIALDYEGTVAADYRVFPLPTNFFIDPDGNIRYIRVGELSLDDVTARFNELRREATALSP